MNLFEGKVLTQILAMGRGYLRNTSAPRRGKLYLRNHFLVDAIRVLPIVVPETDRLSCCRLCSGGAAQHLRGVQPCINLVKHLLTHAALRRRCKDDCICAYPEPKVLR